jgi:hypothetical protein
MLKWTNQLRRGLSPLKEKRTFALCLGEQILDSSRELAAIAAIMNRFMVQTSSWRLHPSLPKVGKNPNIVSPDSRVNSTILDLAMNQQILTVTQNFTITSVKKGNTPE